MGWKGRWPPVLCLGCGAIIRVHLNDTGFHPNCTPSPHTADRLWRLGADMRQYLISTPARRESCKSCGGPIIAALDSGMPAVVDALPIDGGPGAELVWRLAGRATFDLVPIANRKELCYRDEYRIRTRRFPVHGQHACDFAGKTCIHYDPTDYRAHKGKMLGPAPRAAVSDIPPF